MYLDFVLFHPNNQSKGYMHIYVSAEPLIFITLHPLCLKDETVTVFTMDYIMFKSVFPIVMRSKFNKHIYCMQIRYLFSVSLKNRFLCLYLLNNTHFSAQSRLPGEII